MINDCLLISIVFCCLFQHSISYRQDPTTFANLFEGDIIGFSKHKIHALRGKFKQKTAFRNAVKSSRIWEDGIIPFEINTGTGKFDQKFLKTIQEAFNEFHTKTCVR